MGSLLHVFLHVICTRCYEMHVFYVGPGRSAVHGVSFACVFTNNLHTLLRNACILRGPGRDAVHGVSFAYVFTESAQLKQPFRTLKLTAYNSKAV